MPDRPSETQSRVRKELSLVEGEWPGGYFEGNPLDPMATSGYGLVGYLSVLHAIYLACIKPYVTRQTVALEIGPGRGAFTRAILEAGVGELWAVDALPAERNGFWEYVGRDSRVRYEVAEDLELGFIQDESIDYVFSYGCLCHISPPLVERYVSALARVVRPGGRGFLMVADYAKVNSCLERQTELSALRVWEAFVGRRYLPVRWLLRILMQMIPPERISHLWRLDLDEDDQAYRVRWYNLGTDRACAILEQSGFEIVDRDMDICKRDPLIHFVRGHGDD